MSSKKTSARILELPAPSPSRPYSAELIDLPGDGTLIVRDDAGRTQACDWLAHAAGAGLPLAAGDRLLVQPLGATERPVVVGRIGPYTPAAALAQHVAIASAQTLSLSCGESSIELRADGKVCIKGDDVLVRAKGTQRIRAGSVSIN